MGTRAFIEFPTYEWRTELGTPLYNVYGESTGSIYVFVGYDGDTLPLNLHAAFRKLLKVESLATLDPERVAAVLVQDLFEDSGLAPEHQSIRIMAHKPSEGFHLWVDFKSSKVIYVGRDQGEGEGILDLQEWVDHDWAPVFTYDEEDYY